MIPILTAYQIEWNKLHRRLQRMPRDFSLEGSCKTVSECRMLADMLEISPDDLDRLYAIWDENFGDQMAADRPPQPRLAHSTAESAR